VTLALNFLNLSRLGGFVLAPTHVNALWIVTRSQSG
jgi:hypothetical protein